MRREDAFPSKYLKAIDLPEPRVVTIASVVTEPFQNDGREQDKPVIGFKERIKPLICNMTNYDVISDIAGTDETEKWRGVQVELAAGKVPFRGKPVDTVKVHKPPQAQLQANGGSEPPRRPQAAVKPQPAAKPQPPNTQDGDNFWDDEVPFR
jgi:hypothetical protein